MAVKVKCDRNLV